MKPLLKSAFLLLIGLLLGAPSPSQAQVRVNVHVPVWGPRVPRDVQYYYIPEIDGYYDLYSGLYIFYDPAFGDWVSSPVLPRYYAGYDPRYFHPVVIEYVGRRPWGYLPQHRAYCNRWGVRPGRYYGARWPGRGYGAYPRGSYEAYAGRGHHGRDGYDDDRYDRRRDDDDRRGGYGNRRDDQQGDQDDDRRDNRRPERGRGNYEDRGGYEPRGDYGHQGHGGSQERGGYGPAGAAPQSGPAGPPAEGRGRGRGRVH